MVIGSLTLGHHSRLTGAAFLTSTAVIFQVEGWYRRIRKRDQDKDLEDSAQNPILGLKYLPFENMYL